MSTRLAEFLLLNTTAYEGVVESWLPILTWKLTSCALGQVTSLRLPRLSNDDDTYLEGCCEV